jgi:hypothetical protein
MENDIRSRDPQKHKAKLLENLKRKEGKKIRE